MTYEEIANSLAQKPDVEISTMMGTPCLRYKGDFIAMMFDKENSLIVKVSPKRVNEIINEGLGNEFNFTKKRFKKWVLIPQGFEDKYEAFVYEALAYAKIDV